MLLERNLNINDTLNSSSSSNMDSIGEEDSESSNPEGHYTGSVMLPESDSSNTSNSSSISNMEGEASRSSTPKGNYT